MLNLSRYKDEAILVNLNGVTMRIVVTEVRGNKVKLAFDAPPEVRIFREELFGVEPKNPKHKQKDE